MAGLFTEITEVNLSVFVYRLLHVAGIGIFSVEYVETVYET